MGKYACERNFLSVIKLNVIPLPPLLGNLELMTDLEAWNPLFLKHITLVKIPNGDATLRYNNSLYRNEMHFWYKKKRIVVRR